MSEHADVRIIRAATEKHIRVDDEKSFNKALPIVAEQPCLISCPPPYHDYYSTSFDDAADVMSNQLERGSYCVVYPGKVKPTKPKPEPEPPPPPRPPADIVLIRDELGFDRAMELVSEDAIDIIIGNRTHWGVNDFDKAAELITDALLMKVHPLVYKKGILPAPKEEVQ